MMAMNRGFPSFCVRLAIQYPHLCRLSLVHAFGPLSVAARLLLDELVLPPIRRARGRIEDLVESGLAVSNSSNR